MILFKCATLVHLMNAIQIKRKFYTNTGADVILSGLTDFSTVVPKLMKSGIFRNVIVSTDNQLLDETIRSKSEFERRKLTRKPDYLFEDMSLDGKYTELFLGIPYAFDILLYYYLVRKGNSLSVSFYEEAQTTYLRNWTNKIKSANLFNEQYGSKSFLNVLKNVYVYEPELYMGIGVENLIKIPKIECDNETKKIFNSVFEPEVLPNERYIFLEENFIGDNNYVTDIDCLDDLAEFVGKENISVKMHPRSPFDRFAHRGYKLCTTMRLPLELLILNNDISDKVFVTISSGAGVSSQVMFDKEVKSINLYKYMLIGKNFHVREPVFNKYFDKLMEKINDNCVTIFRPENREEFVELIRYLDGGLHCELE